MVSMKLARCRLIESYHLDLFHENMTFEMKYTLSQECNLGIINLIDQMHNLFLLKAKYISYSLEL